jgi:hypothetical protein
MNNLEHLYCDLIDIRWTMPYELEQGGETNLCCAFTVIDGEPIQSPNDPNAHGCASFSFSEI